MRNDFIVFLFLSSACYAEDIYKSDNRSILNLPEGSECEWKGADGKCVSIFRCKSSFIDTRDNDFAPICSLRDTEPVVCCTDCELVNDTRTIRWNPSLGFITKTGQKAQDKCLEYLDKLDYTCKIFKKSDIRRVLDENSKCYRIDTSAKPWVLPLSLPGEGVVGGDDATIDEFPHMALLGYGDNITNADWLCGGSVISEKFILTAGHCISSPATGKLSYVALGVQERTDPLDTWQIYKLKRIVAHPEYRPPSKYHDIALLETENLISFENLVRPACLHIEEDDEETASVTGWGALGYRQQLSKNLQYAFVTRFEEEECSEYYPPHRHLKHGYNHTMQMCYGDREYPKDTCEGDSGGPLQYLDFEKNFGCINIILGVTSFGKQCGIGPGMYTRVSHYLPWIESVVWPED